MMNLAPGPSLLESYRAQPHSWQVILGELIDNAFDAAATRVDVRFTGSKALDVIDDGNGCSDISKMLTLGAHFRQSSTRLGRFGVGLKEAAACLWGTLHIETVHRAVLREASVDWALLAKKSDWMIPDPTESEANGRVGTTLKFRSIARTYPAYDALADELGYTFMPALASGRQIKLTPRRRDPILCRPYQLPPLQNVVSVEVNVDGKVLGIHAGIVEPEHVNRRCGFSFVHGHRVIMNSSLGASGYSTSRVAGIIDLKAGWSLSKNKTALIDADDVLASIIREHLKDMLAAAQNQAMTLTGEAFTKELNERFHAALGTLAKTTRKTKEKRDKPLPGEEQEGTVKPTNSGKKRKPKKTQPGDRLADEAESFARGGTIDWKPCDGDTFGEVDLIGSVVWLNENNRTLLAYRGSDNKDAVLTVAMGLFVGEVFYLEQRDKFPMFRTMDKFAHAWAAIMATCAEAARMPEPVEAP